ncbi:hypothetical protein [uncultured Bradyrhizobium sp.]|uniref:hypothetical protein n=1 Tax=uncultured Bradyrhizobium sp. TaxID=199684 RepID=UPI0035CAE0AE
MANLYDVIEVGMEKPHPVRIITRRTSLKNADAIIATAVARRGVEGHFFTKVRPDAYKDGESYRFGDPQ